MTIQTIRRRRLILLGLAVALLLSAVLGVYAWRKHQRTLAAQQHRVDGMAAFEAGDHFHTLDHLGAYLKTFDEDVEALYCYAQSRRALIEPRGKHLVQAIGVLQRVVDLSPQHSEAQRDLLELYMTCGYNHETLDLASVLIAKKAFEAEAWRAKAVALSRLRQPDEALAAVEQSLAQKPDDLRANVLWFDLRHQRGTPAADLIEAAESLRQQRPKATNLELIQAYVFRLVSDQKRLAEALKAAVAKPVPDEEHTVLLVALLDGARQQDAALAVLDKASVATESARVRGELIRRWWESNRYASIAERLASLDPAKRENDGEQLGFRAAALFELGRRDEATAIVEHLAARGNESLGAAWAGVLRSVYGSAHRSPRAVITACRDGLAVDPGNAYFAYLQGAAWWSLKETDLALAAWRLAIKQRPQWLSPRIYCVHALLAAGQLDVAVNEAAVALQRSQNRVDALIAWVMARAAGLAADDVTGAKELLPALASVQKVMPFEPNTLSLQVSLLAQAGDVEAAGARLKQALKEAPKLDEATCLKLASISRVRGLNLEDECHQRIEKKFGMTPGLALAKAHQLADTGQAEAGKALLKKASADSTSKQHALAWQMVIGRFLDHTEDPSALAHWAAMAAEHADNPLVQTWALQMRCVQADRRVQAQLIDRLRHLSGPEAVTWRLVQANWLLAGDSTSDAATEAASLLQGVVSEAPNSLNARIMLAGSLNRLNLDDRAAAQIIAAAKLQPQSVDLALEAARVLQARHDFAGAKAHLDRLLARRGLDAGTSARIGAMLARQGEDAKAIEVFENLDKQAPLSATQLTLLGTLYRRNAMKERVDSICDRLLKAPTLSGIEFVADWHGVQGRGDEALKVLALLDQVNLEPGEKEAVLAEHFQRFGKTEQAIRMWSQAVAADPSNSKAWREMMAQHLREGKIDQLRHTLDQAVRAMPNNLAIQKLNEQSELMQWALKADTAYHPTLLAMILDERRQDAAVETLATVRTLNRDNLFSVLGQMRLLCQRHADLMPLQVLTVQMHLAHDRARDAATIATGALGAFPTAWEPAWIASEALAAAGRWPEALAAAQQWRARLPGGSMEADMMIAEALLRLRRPEEAAKQLSTYLDRAKKAPQQHRELLQRHCRALLAMNRVDEATQLLTPLWTNSPPWRMWAVDVALAAGGSTAATTQWLDRVFAVIPADSRAEKTRLAATWLSLAAQHSSKQARDRARALIGELVSGPDASAEQWLLAGVLAEQDNNGKSAEHAYRNALKLNPKLPAANNNLAMVLATRGTDLAEAVALAKAAVEARPYTAGFLDTLAFAQYRAGLADEAIASAQQAVALQPDNTQWQTRLSQLIAAKNGPAVVPAPGNASPVE